MVSPDLLQWWPVYTAAAIVVTAFAMLRKQVDDDRRVREHHYATKAELARATERLAGSVQGLAEDVPEIRQALASLNGKVDTLLVNLASARHDEAEHFRRTHG